MGAYNDMKVNCGNCQKHGEVETNGACDNWKVYSDCFLPKKKFKKVEKQ